MSGRESLLAKFRADRWLQHQVLFARRHPAPPSPAHPEIVADFWSAAPELVTMGFRGLAKSTFLEEGVAIGAGERLFRNCLIIGASEARAEDRIRAIGRELLMNEDLLQLYGEQKGPEWTQQRLVTASERQIQGLGRGQDIRGIKYLDWRPDWIIVDDFEDPQNMLSPEGREHMVEWFLAELLPVCDPGAKVRVYGTPMAADSVPMRLMSLEPKPWPGKIFPILYRDSTGAESPIWPERYPMAWIERRRGDYIGLGKLPTWNREYMCDTTSEAGHTFKAEYFNVEPRIRTWQACYAMVDPARTTKRESSATTGIVVFSWVGAKLVVWEDLTGFYSPSEIIDKIFYVDDKYKPVYIGVEEDGLNEWLLQPIRHEQIRRGRYVPVRAMRAPRGKLDFIGGLEPFARAGEIVFASEMPQLRSQFLGFPRGRIDGPNALAYATLIRPGLPMYDGFNPAEHVVERVYGDEAASCWLAANATGAWTAGALVQAAQGRIAVLADWVAEGDPGDRFEEIARDAGLEARSALRVSCPAAHFNEWSNVGLVQEVGRLQLEVNQGGTLESGRAHLRREMGRMREGRPVLQVAERCRWTLNALAGGYARKIGQNEAEPGVYRILMEGLESFCGLMALGVEEDDDKGNFQYDGQGRRYRSVMPTRESYRERRH